MSLAARGPGTITTGMALFNLTDLRAMLCRDQRLIGLDPGSKTIGVALSDVRLMLASPYGSLARTKLKTNAAELAAIARKEGAGGLVVGLPLSMDGSFGPAAQAAVKEAAALATVVDVPVETFDERRTTVTADAVLMERKMNAQARRRVIDKVAAAVMLQNWLDSRGAHRWD